MASHIITVRSIYLIILLCCLCYLCQIAIEGDVVSGNVGASCHGQFYVTPMSIHRSDDRGKFLPDYMVLNPEDNSFENRFQQAVCLGHTNMCVCYFIHI
jgi:hypothetical protein